ncbi:MAG TPA: hypothetical protein VN442_11500 [Bryobacteraceae bacterium]|nr:hypothetical protein [Bryobacteraceae bacterium]
MRSYGYLTLVMLAGGGTLPAQVEQPNVAFAFEERGDVTVSSVPASPGVAVAGTIGAAGAGVFRVQMLDAGMAVEPVKGAPYSAQAVTETIQVLADGNRIQRKITSSVYRDSEGRTRREQSMAGFGPLAPPDGGPEMIFIADPVAGTSYMLDSRTRTAHASGAPAAAMTIRHKMKEGNQIFERRIQIAPGRPAERPEFKSASLGTQMIEGVLAEGTRTVTVIPAGQMGNERPIEIVSERWFSPELKTVVMSRNNDPRTGETTYRLTNLSRSEPPRSLFEVPADYTIPSNR